MAMILPPTLSFLMTPTKTSTVKVDIRAHTLDIAVVATEATSSKEDMLANGVDLLSTTPMVQDTPLL